MNLPDNPVLHGVVPAIKLPSTLSVDDAPFNLRVLEEIERGLGTAYDAHAASACLRLFRERSFRLPAN